MSLPKEESPLFQSSIYPPPSLQFSSLAALSILLQSFLEEQCREKLQGYIWQREAPKVTVDVSSDGDEPSRLKVSMRHGGSIEDEWLLVHLLMLATADERFSEASLLSTLEGRTANAALTSGSLVISARDEDGQFLLIEAADFLPDWVRPDNADGRLWIYRGHFHLIPPEVHPGDLKSSSDEGQFEVSQVNSLRSDTAVPLIRSPSHITEAPSNFEDAIIKQRLPSFPDLSWALYIQHNTLVYVTPKAARALHQHPQLLADAAEAFDGREGPNDARCLREMKAFGPSSGRSGNEGSSDELLVKVKLPRRLYATLLSQRYFPSKAFGDEWRAAISAYWEDMEKASRDEDASDEKGSRTEGRRRDLGCKITCGLELVYANVKERSKGKQSDLFSSGNESELRSAPSYSPFIAALTRIGFFGTNIQDSKEWKLKEREALDLLRKIKPSPSKTDDEHTSNGLQHLVDLVTQKSNTLPLPPHFPSSLPPHALALEEDPDGFLYEVPEQFKRTPGTDGQDGKEMGDDEGETEEERVAMKQVNAFAEKLQGFVEGKGDAAGAMFEDEEMASDDDTEDDPSEVSEVQKSVQEMSHEERNEAMKGLVPGLSLEEWGAKLRPAQQQQPSDAMSVDEAVVNDGEDGKGTDLAQGFSRHIQYDGASDSEESVDDEILRAGDTEEDRQNRAKWLGMERELEEDESNRRMAKQDGDAFDTIDNPQEGEDGEDIRLGQDELLSFIEFTRKELGLSMEQYEDILRKRRERGAYAPDLSWGGGEKKAPSFGGSNGGKKAAFDDLINEQETVDVEDSFETTNHKTGKQIQAERREEHAKSLRNQRTTAEEKEIARQRALKAVQEVEANASRQEVTGISGETPEDPFEKLMKAMDEELAKHKTKDSSVGKGNDFSMGEDGESDDDHDEMSAEDAELLEKMLHSGPPASLRALLEKQNSGDSAGLSSVEQEVMQGMLASYQAQMGGAGPAGALAGRLGVGHLPLNSDGQGG